jgi:hypothetical protein
MEKAVIELAKRLQKNDSFWANKPANKTEQEWWDAIVKSAKRLVRQAEFHEKYGHR